MPRDLPAPAGRLVGRRTVVTALAGVTAVALSGCDTGSSGILPGGSHAAEDADLPLVRQALELSEGASNQLSALTASPALTRRLAPLIAMHGAHAAELSHAGSASPGAPSASASATTAPSIARAIEIEHDAHDRLVGLAQRARSGQLARLLASMAAAISQRMTELKR